MGLIIGVDNGSGGGGGSGGTVNVNKSDGTLISAVTVASGDTEPYNVADSTAVLKDTDGNTLSTTSIKATESGNIEGCKYQ